MEKLDRNFKELIAIASRAEAIASAMEDFKRMIDRSGLTVTQIVNVFGIIDPDTGNLINKIATLSTTPVQTVINEETNEINEEMPEDVVVSDETSEEDAVVTDEASDDVVDVEDVTEAPTKVELVKPDYISQEHWDVMPDNVRLRAIIEFELTRNHMNVKTAYDVVHDLNESVTMFHVFNVKLHTNDKPSAQDIHQLIRYARDMGYGDIAETIKQECGIVISKHSITAATRKSNK